MRMRRNAGRSKEPLETFSEVVGLVGGRLTYLGKVSKAADMIKHAEHMLAVEKAWLLSQIGLIPDHDDDVMDEQKWSSCSWLLLREFVKKHREQVENKKKAIERGEATQDDLDNLPLPRISYVRYLLMCVSSSLISVIVQYECRQIMTRTDFMDGKRSFPTLSAYLP